LGPVWGFGEVWELAEEGDRPVEEAFLSTLAMTEGEDCAMPAATAMLVWMHLRNGLECITIL
jgi:hypothetical protein